MKTLTSTALAAALLFAGTACVQTASAKDKHDNKRDVVQTYDFDGFDEIKVMGVYELEIEVGKSFSVRTEASEKEAEDLDVRVSGDRLILELVPEHGVGPAIRPAERKEHRHQIDVSRLGRVPAAILDVAALTGPCVEQRPQTIGGQRR